MGLSLLRAWLFPFECVHADKSIPILKPCLVLGSCNWITSLSVLPDQRCTRVKRRNIPASVAVSLLVGLLASTTLAGQRATPIRIGGAGKKLTDQDVAELVKVLPAGQVPWLIKGEGPGPFDSRTERFQVYLQPTSATTAVRHGIAIYVTRPTGAPSGWAIQRNREGQTESFNYAQVADGRRPFDEIRDENDPNCPFILVTASDDVELFSLATFVRSQYPGAISSVKMRPPDFLLQIGALKPGEVEVTLRQTSTSDILIDLRKTGQSWEVIRQGILSN